MVPITTAVFDAAQTGRPGRWLQDARNRSASQSRSDSISSVTVTPVMIPGKERRHQRRSRCFRCDRKRGGSSGAAGTAFKHLTHAAVDSGQSDFNHWLFPFWSELRGRAAGAEAAVLAAGAAFLAASATSLLQSLLVPGSQIGFGFIRHLIYFPVIL